MTTSKTGQHFLIICQKCFSTCMLFVEDDVLAQMHSIDDVPKVLGREVVKTLENFKTRHPNHAITLLPNQRETS